MPKIQVLWCLQHHIHHGEEVWEHDRAILLSFMLSEQSNQIIKQPSV